MIRIVIPLPRSDLLDNKGNFFRFAYFLYEYAFPRPDILGIGNNDDITHHEIYSSDSTAPKRQTVPLFDAT